MILSNLPGLFKYVEPEYNCVKKEYPVVYKALFVIVHKCLQANPQLLITIMRRVHNHNVYISSVGIVDIPS